MEMMKQAQMLEEHLAQVEARLAAMEEMGTDPARDLPYDFQDRIGHVRMLLDMAREKLNLAEMAGTGAWEGFHTGVEFACKEAEKAASRLKVP